MQQVAFPLSKSDLVPKSGKVTKVMPQCHTCSGVPPGKSEADPAHSKIKLIHTPMATPPLGRGVIVQRLSQSMECHIDREVIIIITIVVPYNSTIQPTSCTPQLHKSFNLLISVFYLMV